MMPSRGTEVRADRRRLGRMSLRSTAPGRFPTDRPRVRRGGPPSVDLALGLAVAIALIGCDAGAPTVTPVPVPGTSSHPRELIIIAREYGYAPAVVYLGPGETVVIHLVDAGLETHEAVIGDATTQAAWEAAEAAVAGAPPGPTPLVSLSPGAAGLRIVAASGQRVDATWIVPTGGPPLVVGCHIPGHWAQGMQVPVAFATPSP